MFSWRSPGERLFTPGTVGCRISPKRAQMDCHTLGVWEKLTFKNKFTPKASDVGASLVLVDFYDLWARKNLYRATPTLTRGSVFCSPIQRTALSSRLVRKDRVTKDPLSPGYPRYWITSVSLCIVSIVS